MCHSLTHYGAINIDIFYLNWFDSIATFTIGYMIIPGSCLSKYTVIGYSGIELHYHNVQWSGVVYV